MKHKSVRKAKLYTVYSTALGFRSATPKGTLKCTFLFDKSRRIKIGNGKKVTFKEMPVMALPITGTVEAIVKTVAINAVAILATMETEKSRDPEASMKRLKELAVKFNLL